MKKMSYSDKSHLYGQIFLAIAIVIVLAVPILMAVILRVMPNFKVIGGSMVALLFFLLGGIIEVITYAPMLGIQGTYLGFFTGNLINLKVPCAVNAREMVGAKPGTKEAEIVSTISISISNFIIIELIMMKRNVRNCSRSYYATLNIHNDIFNFFSCHGSIAIN